MVAVQSNPFLAHRRGVRRSPAPGFRPPRHRAKNALHNPKPERRTFGETQDTFACRFYHRLVVSSPCEGVSRARVRILVDDPFLGFLVHIKVVVVYPGGFRHTLETDDNGGVELFGDLGAYADLTFTSSIRTHTQRVFILPDSIDTDDGVWQRLANLGYSYQPLPEVSPPSKQALECTIIEFQARHGITPTGVSCSDTVAMLVRLHSSKTEFNRETRDMLEDELSLQSAHLPKDALA